MEKRTEQISQKRIQMIVMHMLENIILYIIMPTINQILEQQQCCSTFSAEVSFTLEDILAEKIDDELMEDYQLDEDEMENFFENKTQSQSEQQSLPILNKSRTSNKFNSKITNTQQIHILDRCRRIQNTTMKPKSQIHNMEVGVLKNVTKLFDSQSTRGIGIPTCISATGGKFLVIGTSLGSIVVFQIGVKGHKILGTSDQNHYGCVSCVSISSDNKYMISGYESGMIILWDMYYFNLVKQQLPSKNRILKVLFCSDDSNCFLVNDSSGNMCLFRIQKYIWVSLQSQKLIQSSNEVYHDVRYVKLLNGKTVVVFCSLDNVYIIQLVPKVQMMGKIGRPQGFYTSKIPNIQIGHCELEHFNCKLDLLCISWGRTLLVYKFIQNGLISSKPLQLLGTIGVNFIIHHMIFINDRIVSLLDGKNCIRSYLISITSKLQLQCINQLELQEEIMYQKYSKDKDNKYLKTYHNVIINYLNQTCKELFFICKHSILRVQLQKWTDYIQNLINKEKQWLHSLKICFELYRGNLQIFCQRVVINDKTIKILCQICRIYTIERIREINKDGNQQPKKNDTIFQIDIIQEVYDTIIEFMLELKQQNYLFNTLYDKTIRQQCPFDEGNQHFLNSLIAFIEKDKIHQINSNKIYRQILSYYIDKNKINILDRLIMNLNANNLHYEDNIEICTNNNMYKSLCYICSINEDYISPVTKIMQYLQKIEQNSMKQKQNYNILYFYLSCLLIGEYINHIKIVNNKKTILWKEITILLTCTETFDFFMLKHELDYFKLINLLIYQLLHSENNYQADIHHIIKQLITMFKMQKKILLINLLLSIIEFILFNYQEIMFIWQYFTDDLDFNCMTIFFRKYHDQIKSTKRYKNYSQLQYNNPQLYTMMQIQLQNTNNMHKNLKNCLNYKQNQNIILQRNILLCKQLINYHPHLITNDNIEQILFLNLEIVIEYLISLGQQLLNSRLEAICNEHLKYLSVRKTLIKLDQDNKKKINGFLLKFYMSCLCKYKNQKRIYKQLRNRFKVYQPYLINLMPIIKNSRFSICIAFIQYATHSYFQAYKHYAQSYQHYFYSNFNALVLKQKGNYRFFRNIYDQMLQICIHINKPEQWLQLLQTIFLPLQQNYKPEKSSSSQLIAQILQSIYHIIESTSDHDHGFIEQLLYIFQTSLLHASTHLSINTMHQFISKNANLLTKKFILNSFSQTLQIYHKNAYIYEMGNQMIIDDQIVQFKQLMQFYKIKGLRSDGFCSNCGQFFSNQEIVNVYKCNHTFHQKCLKCNGCYICLMLEFGEINRVKSMINSSSHSRSKISEHQQNIKSSNFKQQKQEDYIQKKTNLIYKSLAFEEYLRKQQQQLEQFQLDYENKLMNYYE